MTVANADNVTFDDWLQRVRAGDLEAAKLLVDRFESVIRREARFAMRDPSLNALFDSRDVSQSVFASFFIRTQAGQFAIDAQSQLSGLLRCMARRKVAAYWRYVRREKRDLSRVTRSDQALSSLIDSRPGPTQSIEDNELAQQAIATLTAEELAIIQERQSGKSWNDIAAERGGNAHSQRVRLMRALRRSAQRLQKNIT